MKLAVIPARGGSKRIPKKNIRSFHGKPILAYSIENAHASGLFDRIVVSTDDEEIAAVARQYGAEVPFIRPAEIADDFTGTNDVVRHAIKWFEKQGEVIDYVCCIYATAPFMRIQDLQAGFHKLRDGNKSFVISLTSYRFPVQRSVRIMGGNGLSPFMPDYIDQRSQDLEQVYHDAAQFYWGTRDAYINEIPLFAEDTEGVILPDWLVQDIDTPEDWARAELMYQAIGGHL